MKDFQSAEEILDFAIQGEEESYNFYTGLAEKASRREIKDLFTQFAAEEKGHKAKLEAVKKGKLSLSKPGRKITDLKIGDYLVEQKPLPDMDFQQALILAMKKEKASFKLYTDLAGFVHDDDLKNTFLSLAQEEAKHKLRFEIEYDEEILQED